MPVTFWMAAPAQVPAEADALSARARPRLRGSVVLSGDAPRFSTQAAARAPDCGSDMYGLANMPPGVPPSPSPPVMVKATGTVVVFPPCAVMLICAPYLPGAMPAGFTE